MDISDPSLRYQFEELYDSQVVVGLCATRFRGYEYLDREYEMKGKVFAYSALVQTGEFFESELDNWTALFLINRDMHWSGGMGNSFSETSANRFGYYFLFLHLYRQDIGKEYDNRESRWYSLDRKSTESHAGVIRKYLSFVEMDNR